MPTRSSESPPVVMGDGVPTDAHFAAIVASSDDAIIGKTLDSIIHSWNPAAERIFGYSAAEAIGQPMMMLFPPDRLHEEEEIISRIARGETVGHFETVRRRKDGSLVDISATISPIRDREGRVVGASTIARDITEQKRRETELARSNSALEQFAYVASHDLQEPLRAVASCVQLLAKRYQGQLDARADEYIFHAVDGAKRMQQLIDDLLSYSRIGAWTGGADAVDSSAVLADVTARLAASIRESRAVVTSGSLPTVCADRVQLGQLFQNLLTNAIKFRSDAPPVIHVEATAEDGGWRFSVRDNGIGLAREDQDRAFQLFWRRHARTRYPGTGMGLAMCRKIVEGHGGRMWVESAPGEGATFYFSLPVAGGTG